MIRAARLAAAVALAGLLAAGCGDQPATTKPVPPPAPPAPPRPQPASAAVAWGQEVNGVQAGLSAKSNALEASQPIDFVVHVRAVGGKDVQLRDARWQGGWHWIFSPSAGGTAWSADRLEADAHLLMNLQLAEGKEQVLPFRFAEPEWRFEDARWDEVPPGPLPADSPFNKMKFAEPVKALPPGKYTVTASYEHPEHRGGDCPYWHGQVTTGPVEIEIKPKAAAQKVP